jgi:hypothetical protein
MLKAISWQQYMTAVILLSAAWYTYVGLRYYQPELSAFLRIKPQPRPAVPPVAHQMTGVVGEAKAEADTGLLDSAELIFSSDETLPKDPSGDLLA